MSDHTRINPRRMHCRDLYSIKNSCYTVSYGGHVQDLKKGGVKPSAHAKYLANAVDHSTH